MKDVFERIVTVVILKIFKVIFLFLAICIIGYCISRSEKPDKLTEVSPLVIKKNSGEVIRYSKRFKNGTLLLSAKMANLKTNDCVFMEDMEATFKKGNRIIIVKAKACELNTKEKKVYLKKNVQINSEDMICNTESAIIDLESNLITGNSKVSGSSHKTKFTSDGFSIHDNGQIKLKRAVITKVTK
ncbi:MAG: LPS export ABC transporter periplasmic protein LptC [Holosporales bacterium]|nr:LPS export ABC transporter periplasmic protein LptC [Holosporales bacterium]